MSSADRIAWSSADRYSPVQQKSGVAHPRRGELPPITQRVNQHPDPYLPAYLDERETLRVTYQGDDRCQLSCPGCYTGQRLGPGAPGDRPGGRRQAPTDDVAGHLDAAGPGIRELYLIGAEPTMDPEGSAGLLRDAAGRGWTATSITNGAVSPRRFDRTFGEALEAGGLYSLTVSLDSTVPAVNNRLRGAAFAYDRAMATIRRCVQRGVPLNVQMTVWPLSYATVLDSVQTLFEAGVRGFSFHCGSVEGVPHFLAEGLDHIDPLAWRALCERLYAFRDEHADELEHFVFPLLYFTEEELRDSVLGDEAVSDAYLMHVEAAEAGSDAALPFRACPAVDVPQVYVFGNDGPEGRGSVSLCNIHTGEPPRHFAHYEPASRRFRVVQDPAGNQMQDMLDSPHLCPAMTQATGGRLSDRVRSEEGSLYHACRYLSSNQVPVERGRFTGRTTDRYEEAADLYRVVALGLEREAASRGRALPGTVGTVGTGAVVPGAVGTGAVVPGAVGTGAVVPGAVGTGAAPGGLGAAVAEPWLARVRRLTAGVPSLSRRADLLALDLVRRGVATGDEVYAARAQGAPALAGAGAPAG